ncbi:IclR family transcriptional regulator C-terminal domain-containing protein [Streptomyces sp. NPDC000151]|uniref:IclR family transcriptional regulator domain-containing protein n=1 Tax=Streptomyces sp. NPDC000151 TaxID=3154244 RepID=UPI00331A20E2
MDAQLLVHEPLRRRMRADIPDRAVVAAAVHRQITEIRERGYCFDRDTLLPGVSGLAAPIPSATSDPSMAITMSAINDRLPPERIRELAPFSSRQPGTLPTSSADRRSGSAAPAAYRAGVTVAWWRAALRHA